MSRLTEDERIMLLLEEWHRWGGESAGVKSSMSLLQRICRAMRPDATAVPVTGEAYLTDRALHLMDQTLCAALVTYFVRATSIRTAAAMCGIGKSEFARRLANARPAFWEARRLAASKLPKAPAPGPVPSGDYAVAAPISKPYAQPGRVTVHRKHADSSGTVE